MLAESTLPLMALIISNGVFKLSVNATSFLTTVALLQGVKWSADSWTAIVYDQNRIEEPVLGDFTHLTRGSNERKEIVRE